MSALGIAQQKQLQSVQIDTKALATTLRATLDVAKGGLGLSDSHESQQDCRQQMTSNMGC